MPPSGDELVLKLLSQFVARQVSGGKKRKQEEEVTFQKSVKEVNSCQTEVVTIKADMIESLVVYHHLEEVTPNLAEEFSALHTFPRVLNHLKEVSPNLAEDLLSFQRISRQPPKMTEDIPVFWSKTYKVSDKETPVNKKTGITPKKFTPQEDIVINAALEEAGGGPIDIVSIAKRLNRHRDSVNTRIKTLKRTGGVIKKTNFSLVEDIILLESLIIPRLATEKLSKIVLKKRHYADLSMQLGKSDQAVGQRWSTSLQPWLLQHYAGTLNLRVERMLANYILDNYSDFSSINWLKIATKSEFAGHTEHSLRRVYLAKLCNNSKTKLGLQSKEMTPQHIADYCDSVYGVEAAGLSKARASMNKSRRQSEIISYFERRVSDLKLENFIYK